MVDVINQDRVRISVEKYVQDYGATWAYVSRETKISNSLISIWKSGNTNLGLDNFNNMVDFLQKKGMEI